MANGTSDGVTGVERKWRLVRGRVAFTHTGGRDSGKMRTKGFLVSLSRTTTDRLCAERADP